MDIILEIERQFARLVCHGPLGNVPLAPSGSYDPGRPLVAMAQWDLVDGTNKTSLKKWRVRLSCGLLERVPAISPHLEYNRSSAVAEC